MAVQKRTAMCKMNEFPRRHFYVPFGEFVHLHMQYYDMSVERFFAIHYCLSAICRQAFLV